MIPQGIITKPPSAELKPDQKDEDSLPPYSVLDPILKAYIEDNMSPSDIAAQGFEAQIVNEVIKKVNRSEFKRRQAPPILRNIQRFWFRQAFPDCLAHVLKTGKRVKKKITGTRCIFLSVLSTAIN